MRNWRPWPRACWYQYTDRCPNSGEHLSITCCFLDLIRYLGVWVTSESTRPVGEETRKLRAEHREASCCSPHPGFYLREIKTSQKLQHGGQASPAPRRKRSHSRGAWSPWQHQEHKTAAGLGVGLLGECGGVLTLLLP